MAFLPPEYTDPGDQSWGVGARFVLPALFEPPEIERDDLIIVLVTHPRSR